MEKKDLSIKVQWVKAYYEDVEIATLADFLMNNKFRALFLECNLKGEHAQFIVNDGFWQDVLKAWSNYHYSIARGMEQVLKQMVWYNSDITSDGKLINNRLAIQQGFMTSNRIVSFMQYCAVVKSVKKN